MSNESGVVLAAFKLHVGQARESLCSPSNGCMHPCFHVLKCQNNVRSGHVLDSRLSERSIRDMGENGQVESVLAFETSTQQT